MVGVSGKKKMKLKTFFDTGSVQTENTALVNEDKFFNGPQTMQVSSLGGKGAM